MTIAYYYAGSTFIVPSDFNPSLKNSVEMWGAGGGAGDYKEYDCSSPRQVRFGGGGGGGGYIRYDCIDFRPGQYVGGQIGRGGGWVRGYYIGCTHGTAGGGTGFGSAFAGGGGGGSFGSYGVGQGVGGAGGSFSGSLGQWPYYTKNGKTTFVTGSYGGTGSVLGGGGNGAYYGGNSVVPGWQGGSGGSYGYAGKWFGGGSGACRSYCGLPVIQCGGAPGVLILTYNYGDITSRLTNDGRLLLNGTYDEVTTSTISLARPGILGRTTATYYANELDDYTLSIPNGSISFNSGTTNQNLIVPGTTLDADPLNLATLTTPWWTIEFWIKFNATNFATDQTIFDLNSGIIESCITIIKYSSGNIQANIGRSIKINIGTVISDNWYHIALICRSNTLIGMINGNRTATAQLSSPVDHSSTTSTALTIGAYTNLQTLGINNQIQQFSGLITDFRITKDALYNTTSTVSFTPTVALPVIPKTSILFSASSSTTYLTDNGPYSLAVIGNFPNFSTDFPVGNIFAVRKRETRTGTLMVSGELNEINVPHALY